MSACPNEEVIADWLLGEIDDAERSRVEKHLAACADCRSLREQFGTLKQKLGRRAMKDTPAGFTDQVMAKIRQLPPPVQAPTGILASLGLGSWLKFLVPAVGCGLAAVFLMLRSPTERPGQGVEVAKLSPAPVESMSVPVVESPLPGGSPSVAPAAPARSDQVEIASLSGGAEIVPAGGSPAAAAIQGALATGAVFSLKSESRLELAWRGTGTVKVEGAGPGSGAGRLQIGKTGVELAGASVQVDLEHPPGGFQVRTPQVEVRVLGTMFTVDNRVTGYTQVVVQRGRVEVENLRDHSRVILTAGQSHGYGQPPVTPAVTPEPTSAPVTETRPAVTPRATPVLDLSQPAETPAASEGQAAETIRTGF